MKARSLRHHALCLFALLIFFGASAQAAASQLTGVSMLSGQGQQVALRLSFNGSAPSPRTFTTADPARLIIDLPGAGLAVSDHSRDVEQGPIEKIQMAQADGKTRVIVGLTAQSSYHITRQSDDLIVTFGGASQAASSYASAGTNEQASAEQSQNQGQSENQGQSVAAGGNASSIQNIVFRRGDHGAGRIEIMLNGDQAPVNLTRKSDTLVATLPGVSLPQRLARRLDVTDFATPVKTIDAMSRGGGTRLVITPENGADFEPLAYQVGDQLVIELQPLTQAQQQQQQANHPQYHGKKISLSFQNIEIRKVLQIIADVAKVNMVVADDVTGNITLQLDDVPWDQALDIILNAKGLGMERTGNVITVSTLNDIKTRNQEQAAARAATNNLAPLESQIIQINYANAANIANILQSDSSQTSANAAGPTGTSNENALAASTGVGVDNGLAGALANYAGRNNSNNNAGASVATGGNADGQSILSPRGHVTVDERTNSLLITDTAEKIAEVRRLIAKLDVPVRQVLIESRIVVANRDFTRSLGISQTGVDNSRLNNALAAQNSGGLASPYDANNGGYSIGLPATGATSVLSSSIITDTFSLNLELSAMESDNNGEIISSPRVITADGREANIEQGREIPYQSGSSGSLAGTSVEFKKAVLSLNVTPKITPDDKVIMNLNVTQDSVGQVVATSNGGSVPSIDTRSLQTQVLVANGDTVVLGGIFEQDNTNETGGVPFLRKIPLIGALFSSQNLERQKRELLIFVTPRILDTRLNAGS